MKIKKILMVDDDPFIRKVGEMALNKVGGWEVTLAGSGDEALRLAATDAPDVILLDVMMPNMDGPSTLKKLRQVVMLQSIPVIFITAKVQLHEMEQYLSMDAQGVVSKPFDPITLPQEIENIVENARRYGRMADVAASSF